MRKYIWNRATAEDFATTDPILEKSVIGYETDTNYYKIGDGVTKFSELPYINKPKSAYDIAVENGFVGTEEEWLVSLSSESAYQKALALGFTGTEDEYYTGTIIGVTANSWGSF